MGTLKVTLVILMTTTTALATTKKSWMALIPKVAFSCKSGCFSFDVDEILEAQPLTDGLLVIRHLFGFSGDSLTSGAVSARQAETPQMPLRAT